MIKKFTSISLILFISCILTGCGSKTTLVKQAELLAQEITKKPADKYEEHYEKDNVYVHIHKMDKNELKKYYDRVNSSFYDVYFVAITNKSDKNIILSVSDTSVSKNNGQRTKIGNNVKKLMKKGDDGIAVKASKSTGIALVSAVSWGLLLPVMLTTWDSNQLQKAQEIYYQTTYDKGLKSVVLPPYYTTSGFLVLPDKPFLSYKSINLKFQKTQELEYFDIEYPMSLTTDKLRKQKQEAKLKEVEQNRKNAQKEREKQLEELKKKNKGL
ncbi:MAG: hypothetical protein PHV68_01590 [Candidatus Gastranaerophilales bacterium]|nr:hypothetical protein [Candidatus Gastranaerophilales bacterium]